ncbi:MAG: hypothetical protein QNK37_30570 [Acidobacteriota bacterium]|nr:hypothetical protein [Acidobacteriota bacterium]
MSDNTDPNPNEPGEKEKPDPDVELPPKTFSVKTEVEPEESTGSDER